jgi:hypothetical protein
VTLSASSSLDSREQTQDHGKRDVFNKEPKYERDFDANLVNIFNGFFEDKLKKVVLWTTSQSKSTFPLVKNVALASFLVTLFFSLPISFFILFSAVVRLASLFAAPTK